MFWGLHSSSPQSFSSSPDSGLTSHPACIRPVGIGWEDMLTHLSQESRPSQERPAQVQQRSEDPGWGQRCNESLCPEQAGLGGGRRVGDGLEPAAASGVLCTHRPAQRTGAGLPLPFTGRVTGGIHTTSRWRCWPRGHLAMSGGVYVTEMCSRAPRMWDHQAGPPARNHPAPRCHQFHTLALDFIFSRFFRKWGCAPPGCDDWKGTQAEMGHALLAEGMVPWLSAVGAGHGRGTPVFRDALAGNKMYSIIRETSCLKTQRTGPCRSKPVTQ